VVAGESAAASGRPYVEQIRDWARTIVADQTPVKGGFAPAPVFPTAPMKNPGT
jgi:hypothetical protein